MRRSPGRDTSMLEVATLLNRMKIYADSIAKLLAPGERPLAFHAVAYFDGFEDLGQPRSKYWSVDGFIDRAFGIPSDAELDLTQRWVTGTSLAGFPGCKAQQIAQRIGLGQHDLLVTDRRLMLVDVFGDMTSPTNDLTHVMSIPRGDVVLMRRKPRLFQAGRFWVGLNDGSSLSLMSGLFRWKPAKNIVQAWFP